MKKVSNTMRTLGTSTHAIEDREINDYYATDPIAGELLLQLEPQLNNIWECACGEGHLANVFEQAGKLGFATDIINRGYGHDTFDFLQSLTQIYNGDIVTNPPFKYAQQFIEKALDIISHDRYVCMFLKLQFLEGKARKELFEKYPPIRVWVSSSRITCAKNGKFDEYPSSAVCYAWFVWKKGYKGTTELKWFN